MERNKAMEFIIGQMAKGTKANGKMVSNMVKAK